MENEIEVHCRLGNWTSCSIPFPPSRFISWKSWTSSLHTWRGDDLSCFVLHEIHHIADDDWWHLHLPLPLFLLLLLLHTPTLLSRTIYQVCCLHPHPPSILFHPILSTRVLLYSRTTSLIFLSWPLRDHQSLPLYLFHHLSYTSLLLLSLSNVLGGQQRGSEVRTAAQEGPGHDRLHGQVRRGEKRKEKKRKEEERRE